jgi:hypothetical protein
VTALEQAALAYVGSVEQAERAARGVARARLEREALPLSLCHDPLPRAIEHHERACVDRDRAHEDLIRTARET